MKTFVRHFPVFAGSMLVLGAVGCAPKTNPTLTRVEAQFISAQTAGKLPRQAPLAWDDAEAQLAAAQREWREDRDSEETAHLAYLAEQKLEIARLRAAAEAERDQRVALAQQHAETAARIGSKELQMARGRAEYLGARVRELQAELEELQTRQTNRGLEITLGDVHFQHNRADLKPGAYRRLEPIARYLRDEPRKSVVVEGHTDSTGTAAYNRQLSQDRAEAVRSALIANGVDPERITSRGLGESLPITSNDTAAGRLQNRRVEIIIQ